MKKSASREANNRTAVLQIFILLRNAKFRYYIHKPLVSTHSLIDRIHIRIPYLFRINYNILHCSWLRRAKRCLPIKNFAQSDA
jgi:hypothetical protein